MAVVQDLADLLENLGSCLFVEVFGLDNAIIELAAFADFGNEVDIDLILEVLVELDDVGMVKGLENLDLSLEASPILNLVPWDHLDGPLLASFSVNC